MRLNQSHLVSKMGLLLLLQLCIGEKVQARSLSASL
jgi:hypothetical protein